MSLFDFELANVLLKTSRSDIARAPWRSKTTRNAPAEERAIHKVIANKSRPLMVILFVDFILFILFWWFKRQ